MSGLARVQRHFQEYLLREEQGIEAHVLGSARVPLSTRLGIYGRAYRSRLAEALESNFPMLAKLLGAADFSTLAADYVRAHDSPFFSIRYYGDALPQFLASHEDYTGAPVLAELARWEWSMTCVFDAADAEPLTHAALSRVAPQQWAQLRFSWHPSVHRLALTWNVPQLWQALSEDAERPAASLNPAPVQWLLWRRELTTYFRSLPAPEVAVLDAARQGRSFGGLCELLCTQLGEAQAAGAAAELLRDWIASGLIVGAA
jgi:hypothetical protein